MILACLASFALGALLSGLAALTRSRDLDDAERRDAGQRHLYEN